MPADTPLLDRDLARRAIASSAGGILDVLRDVVDEGTALLGRVVQTVGAAGESRAGHVGLALLLRHAVEMADGVDELVRAGAVQPSLLQVRAILEARMQLLYVLGARNPVSPNPLGPRDHDPVPRDRTGAALTGAALAQVQDSRGAAYFVAEIRRQLRRVESLDPAAMGDRLEELLGTRTVPSYITDPAVQAEATAGAASLRAILSEPAYAPANAEFDRMRGRSSHDVQWYSLWGGPRSVRALARSVGMAFQYDAMYAGSSRVTHGGDVLAQLGRKLAGGGRSVAPLRQPDRLRDVVASYVIHMLMLYRSVMEEVRPDELERVWPEWLRRWWPAAQAAR
ncbi:MAG TPA: hypothetical protein VF746_31500 [Longimicrobium sp.]|jgi:hypothetical protein